LPAMSSGRSAGRSGGVIRLATVLAREDAEPAGLTQARRSVAAQARRARCDDRRDVGLLAAIVLPACIGPDRTQQVRSIAPSRGQAIQRGGRHRVQRSDRHLRRNVGPRGAGAHHGPPPPAAAHWRCRSPCTVREYGWRWLVAHRRLSDARLLRACAERLGRAFRHGRGGTMLRLPCGPALAGDLAASVRPRRKTFNKAASVPDLDTDRARHHPPRAFAGIVIGTKAPDEIIVGHSCGIEQTKAISWHTSAPLLPATAQPDRCMCQANKNAVIACSLYGRCRKAVFRHLISRNRVPHSVHCQQEESVDKVSTFSIGKQPQRLPINGDDGCHPTRARCDFCPLRDRPDPGVPPPERRVHGA
jgi:hypothetical protein